MARTFISQPNQIFNTENYDDTLAAGSTLQTTASNLEADLNAIRSQLRRILWAGVSGSWYDAITAPSGSNSARGLNTINTDLTDLEQKRFLFRKQNLNVVNVATGSNVAFLSVSLGTTPENFMVVYHPSLAVPDNTGSIVALLSGAEGSYGSHSLAQASGSTVITPKNLVIVRDAWTGMLLTASSGTDKGRDIYGLLQVESGSASGDSFSDSLPKRAQISFVVERVTNQTSSFVAAAAGDVGGRSINYSYVRRTALDDIPEDAYLSNTVFLDLADAFSGNFATLSDITLDRAIDNQVGTVTMDQNISIRIAAGFAWTFLSGTKELWKLVSDNSTDTLTVAVDRIGFSSSFASAFEKGVSVATGSSQINLGVTAGTINTLTGTNLVIKGGNQLNFADDFGDTSNYLGGAVPLATSTLEWNNWVTAFGNQSTILGAMTYLSNSLSSSVKRSRTTAGVTTNVNANVNVTNGTNLDAALGSYVGRDFKKDLEIYLNGILLLPGTSTEQNDVYPGDSAATGDLKFPYKVRSGSQISMVIYG